MPQNDAQDLIQAAAAGDDSALTGLMERHRERLRNMVRVRMDERIQARVDPSDVIQDALQVAARELPSYAREQPIAFYPWLRSIAWQQLMRAHERHLHAAKRSVAREERYAWQLSTDSTMRLAGALVDPAASPSGVLQRRERIDQLRSLLHALPEEEREILLQRYLEHMTIAEIAASLGATEASVRMRQLRVLRKLRDQFTSESTA